MFVLRYDRKLETTLTRASRWNRRCRNLPRVLDRPGWRPSLSQHSKRSCARPRRWIVDHVYPGNPLAQCQSLFSLRRLLHSLGPHRRTEPRSTRLPGPLEILHRIARRAKSQSSRLRSADRLALSLCDPVDDLPLGCPRLDRVFSMALSSPLRTGSILLGHRRCNMPGDGPRCI